MAKNQKNQGFAAIRDVVSSSRFRESRLQVSNAPISHSDFQGTVAEIITQKKNTLNRKSIWDIKEDSVRKRVLQGETWDGIKNTFFYVEYEGAQEELVDQLRNEGIIE